MGHHLTGLIGRADALKHLGEGFDGQPRFALAEGLAFMPLDHENLDEITGLHNEKALHDFVYLTPHLVEILRRVSTNADIAYIETAYHGGSGGQGAVTFSRGACIYGPNWSDQGVGPINEALKLVGVATKIGKVDAFDTVGLDAFRSNESFRERATAL